MVVELSESGSHIVRACRHFPAGFGTSAAGFGAGFAMVVLMLATFGCAGLAKVRAKLTHIGRVRAVAGHERYGHVTNFGAVAVSSDTVEHHMYVLLTQAGFRTGIAAYGTSLTGIDAFLIRLGS